MSTCHADHRYRSSHLGMIRRIGLNWKANAMAIFEVGADAFREIKETTFSGVGIKERSDLQRLLRGQIQIISPDTLIVAEEFGEWEDSKRRIDLLGVDNDANLVVVELKRTEDGGHMDLQAVRYAAMVSTLTFDKVIDVFARYLNQLGRDEDPRTILLDFLGWDDPDEEQFAPDVRIVLVSAEFSKELTSSVLWLNDRDLDIRCIRVKPYDDNGRILVDVQQVIPLPEATEYQVQIKEKQQREKVARETFRDLAKYDVTIAGTRHDRLPKNRAIFTVVKFLCDNGVTPEEVQAASRAGRELFQTLDGTLDSAGFGIPAERRSRYFCVDGELIHSAGKTYAFTNQWGLNTFTPAMDNLLIAFPGRHIIVAKSP
jgi:hypothetical protein